MNIIVCNTTIGQDAEGRFRLNDLHKTAGGERRHGPSLWLETQQAQELAKELSDTGIPVSVIKGGLQQGTYVVKELVYAYAMWISMPIIRNTSQTLCGRPAWGFFVIR